MPSDVDLQKESTLFNPLFVFGNKIEQFDNYAGCSRYRKFVATDLA